MELRRRGYHRLTRGEAVAQATTAKPALYVGAIAGCTDAGGR